MDGQIFIKLIADGLVLPIVAIGAYALVFRIPKGQKFAAYTRILMAGLTAYMIAKFLGTIYQPSSLRPFELLGLHPGASYLNNPGFPSDHALFTAAITLAVWFETRHKTISILLAFLTILVCVGRVLALVHTPLDVTAGVIVAAIGAVWYLQRDDIIAKFAKT